MQDGIEANYIENESWMRMRFNKALCNNYSKENKKVKEKNVVDAYLIWLNDDYDLYVISIVAINVFGNSVNYKWKKKQNPFLKLN